MTEKDFDEAYARAENGDFFSIDISDEGSLKDDFGQLAGVLIQFGTGGYAHIGYVREKDIDMSVEAIDKGTVPTNIVKAYRGKSSVGITFWRLKDMTPEKLKIMNDTCDTIVGQKHPYAWGNVLRLGGRALLCKIPLLGWFINKFVWKIPYIGDDGKDLFCSEVATIIARSADKEFRKDYQPNEVTPTMFCESSHLIQVSRAVGSKP